MADTKISGLTALTGANTASGDLLTIVDVSDNTMAATGTNKKITLTELQSAPVSAGTANGVLYLNGSKVATAGSALTFDGTTFKNTAGGAAFSGVIGAGVSASASGRFRAFNPTNDRFVEIFNDGTVSIINSTYGSAGASPLTFQITDSEQMRLTSTGLGIGTSSPGYKLDVNGVTRLGAGSPAILAGVGGAFAGGQGELYTIGTNTMGIGTTGAASLRFYTASAEAARIDSSGNLLVGTTNSSASVGSGFKVLPANNGANNPQIAIVTAATANSTASLSLYSTGAGAYRFYVADGGTIYATSTSISAISDQRLKENIQDLNVGLDAVMALKPRKFDWKTGKGKDIKGDRGFIAQEFEQVFPDLIDEWKDPAPEGEEPYKSVRQDLIPVLVKAIQEQQAIIQQLTARVAQLESN